MSITHGAFNFKVHQVRGRKGDALSVLVSFPPGRSREDQVNNYPAPEYMTHSGGGRLSGTSWTGMGGLDWNGGTLL